jgi:hypothetical protein
MCMAGKGVVARKGLVLADADPSIEEDCLRRAPDYEQACIVFRGCFHIRDSPVLGDPGGTPIPRSGG